MKSLAEFLEREGGQIFLMTALLLIFAVLAFFSPTDSPFFEKVALVGFGTVLGALIMVMKGNGNGKHPPTQPEPPKTP